MRRSMPITLCLSLLCGTVAAQDSTLYSLRAPIPVSARTQILVLGTEHLRGLEGSYDPTVLMSLLDALERFGPDLIAVEALPPSELVRLAAAPGGPATPLLEQFGGGAVGVGRQAQTVLGMTRAEADSAASALLGDGTRDASAHRSLAMRFLAAYDAPSAALHWAALPVAERTAGPGVPGLLADDLDERLESASEIYGIAVPLALRLGHDRLASVDDHIDDEIGLATGYYDRLVPELQATEAYAELAASDYLRDARTRLREAAETGDLLPLYTRLNDPAYLDEDVRNQWHLFFRSELPSGLDRRRTALWEARNLIMAARLRAASAFEPGGRVLFIVGAAHKAFIDRYLAQMMDVEVVHLADFVK